MQPQLSSHPDSISAALELAVAGVPSRRRQYIWLALLLAGPLLLLMLRLFPSLDQSMFHDALGHVVITSSAAIIGVILALLVLHVAQRARDGRVFLIGMGFLSSASIFITHSISTPDVLMSGRGSATAISALASLWLGCLFFALSGLNLAPSFNSWLMRHVRIWLILFLVFWLAYNWIFLVAFPSITLAQATVKITADVAAHPAARPAPGLAPAHIHAQQPEQDEYAPAENQASDASTGLAEASTALMPLDILRTALLLSGLGCYAFAISRHYSFYRRSPSQAGLGITCGMAFFGEALITQYFSQVYTFSFWLYHAQEFAGFAVIGYAVLGAYRRGLTDETLLESLFLSGTRARLQAGYSNAMESLVETLSRGEQPTPALRDALRARFGMAESQVRVLEEAATAVAQERRQRQELERLNQSLRQLEANKSQLTQMIVHDLKNPLTALLGFLEILKMDRLTDDQRLLLVNALRSGRNLSNLIGDLLDVGRIEEGRLELERGTLAPRDLLNDCADEMRGWLMQEDKTIAIEAQVDLRPLYVDRRLVRRMMLNLVSNAIKHTPPGTHITLRVTHQVITPAKAGEGSATITHQFIIEVADDGFGIPPERLERIFDKFGRFTNEQPARQDSTGLGLTLCRLVAEAHGGTIGVTSIVGKGTTFRVTLPDAERP
jgi:signal transduction histidine kinase